MGVGTTLSVVPWHLPQSGNEYNVLVTNGEGLAYVMIMINELVPPLMLGTYIYIYIYKYYIYIYIYACICSRCVATKRTHLNRNIILVVYCTISLMYRAYYISSNVRIMSSILYN